jgi:hypothetical protein
MVANSCPMKPLASQLEQADGATAAADPHQLVRPPLMMGREHHPDAGHHRVEVVVRERK